MGRILFQALLAVVLVGVVSCKPEFEKIRTSGDSKLIYEKAVVYYDAEEWYKAQQLFEMLIN
ncbi:MAG TPA: outer membrane protein assembly factor BamD, partial [Saprospiraceae bacterium]|nr:outer membrane protein assembly factor BamD [Saprospiraceae bacterium]